MVASSRFFFQLNEGEQLYASILPGYLARIASAKRRASFEVRLGGFAPNQIGVRRVGKAARDGGIQPAANAEEAFRRALAGEKLGIAWIDVAGQQMGAVGVGAGHNQGRHAHDVGRQTRRHQLLDGFAGRHQHFASHVPALLGRGQLVLEVDARHTRFDHRLHQLEGVQGAAETRLGIRHQGSEPTHAVFPLRVMDLVGARQGLIDAARHVRHAARRVQALVRVHLAGVIGVRGHLPAADIDGLQPRLDLLDGLIAGHRAQRGDVRFCVQQVPQPLRAEPGQRVLHHHRASQPDDVIRCVRTLNPFPARIGFPDARDHRSLTLPGQLIHHISAPLARAASEHRIRPTLPVNPEYEEPVNSGSPFWTTYPIRTTLRLTDEIGARFPGFSGKIEIPHIRDTVRRHRMMLPLQEREIQIHPSGDGGPIGRF